MQSQLQQIIDQATQESLQQTNPELNRAVINQLNSRPDVPKEGIKILKRKVMSRNPKVQLLTLDLISQAMEECKLPFHTQVGSKDFMLTLTNVLKLKEGNQQVKNSILKVIQIWGLRFQSSKDILPNFLEIYQNLIEQGFQFPEKPVGIQQQYNEPSQLPQSGSGKSYEYPKQAPVIDQQKLEKLRRDLEVVRNNINLSNEMIDAHNMSTSVKQNEILQDLMKTIRAMDSKMVTLIANITDEQLMQTCLSLNEDLKKTLDRYQKLERGIKPDPYYSSSLNVYPSAVQQTQEKQQYQQPQVQQVPQQKAPQQVDLLDVGAEEEQKVPQQKQTQQSSNFNVLESLLSDPVQTQPKQPDPFTALEQMTKQINLQQQTVNQQLPTNFNTGAQFPSQQQQFQPQGALFSQGMNPGMNQGMNPGMNQGMNPGMNLGMNQGMVPNQFASFQGGMQQNMMMQQQMFQSVQQPGMMRQQQYNQPGMGQMGMMGMPGQPGMGQMNQGMMGQNSQPLNINYKPSAQKKEESQKPKEEFADLFSMSKETGKPKASKDNAQNLLDFM